MMKKALMGMSIAAALITTLASPRASEAASTCVTKLIQNVHANDATCRAGAWMTMVIHRKNNTWVSYSVGTFEQQAGGMLVASKATQQFSDRRVASSSLQNFAINKQDSHTIKIDPTTNVMTIVNHTWNFTTVVGTTCSGNLIQASDAAHVYSISHQPGICVI